MKRPPPPRERDIQRAVMDLLGAKGFVVYRRTTGLLVSANGRRIRTAPVGASDLYGWHRENGRHIEVETKRPNIACTPAQAAWLLRAREQGCVAFAVASVEACERLLKVYGY